MAALQFFGQEIKVTVSAKVKVPVSFHLGDQEYIIGDIIQAWHDYGFGKASLHHENWRQRHHRNYYRVKTTEDETFEIYHDRGTSLEQARKMKWFVSRRL